MLHFYNVKSASLSGNMHSVTLNILPFHRNVNSDDDFTDIRIPSDSTRYTLTNLEPNDVYGANMEP